jgi:hypothetical protein
MTFEKSKLAAEGLLAALFLAALLVPAVQANPADDDVSRTFTYVGAPRMTHGGVRAGWLDSSTPGNACLLSLFSLQVPVGGVNYYETLRVTSNVNVVPATLPGLPPIPLPCPSFINPSCTALSGCALRLDPITVRGGTLVYQDALLCTQSSFADCMPTEAGWAVSTCAWADASFATRPSGPNEGVLGGTGLENVLLSKDINCGGSGYTRPSDRSQQLVTFGRNVVSSLGRFRVYADGAERYGFPIDFVNAGADSSATGLVVGGMGAFAVASEVAPGAGTRYLVSCLFVKRTVIDLSTIPPSISYGVVEDSVDWFLVLDDMDTNSNWVGALVKHVGPGGFGGNLGLQGLYDQGGDNDCDFLSADYFFPPPVPPPPPPNPPVVKNPDP